MGKYGEETKTNILIHHLISYFSNITSFRSLLLWLFFQNFHILYTIASTCFDPFPRSVHDMSMGMEWKIDSGCALPNGSKAGNVWNRSSWHKRIHPDSHRSERCQNCVSPGEQAHNGLCLPTAGVDFPSGKGSGRGQRLRGNGIAESGFQWPPVRFRLCVPPFLSQRMLCRLTSLLLLKWCADWRKDGHLREREMERRGATSDFREDFGPLWEHHLLHSG